MWRFTLIVFCAALLLSSPTPAEVDFYAGLDAYDKQDYATAFRVWSSLAETGDAESQYRLGRLYADGLGVETDPSVAVRWYQTAAEQGHARAQSSLGYMLHRGLGVDADILAAIAWYERAAEQGRTVAQRNLGQIYLDGDGVDVDLEQAVKWLDQASSGGNAAAQTLLGNLYEQGRGVGTDPDRAFKLYRRAAKQEDIDGEFHLGRAYARGIGTTRNVKKALLYLERASSQGSTEAEAERELLLAGPTADVAEDPIPEVVEDVKPAALPSASTTALPTKIQSPEQAYARGRALLLGDGVPRNLAAAERWLLQAAEAGHAEAAYRLGLLLYRGQGQRGDRDFVGAWIWLSRAAALGVGDAATWRDRVEKKMTDRERTEAAQRLES